MSLEMLNQSDRSRIERRAMRLLEHVQSSTGMRHLSDDNPARLTPLRGGLPVTKINNEHEADKIAAALHAEMP